MVKRHSNHQIDTLAVRKIMATLSENWLIRNMDERDYGIDLMIEYFDGSNATGQICYIQVKGKRRSFPKKKITLGSFPVKTAKYSQLFEAPFFVFHTSLDSNKTVFVWLQKYIDCELELKKWQNQKTITINFPSENILDKDSVKIIEILDRHSVRPDSMRFLARLNELELHSKSVLNGEYAVAEYCKYVVDKIKKENRFFSHYCLGKYPVSEDLSLIKLKNAYSRISKNKKISKIDKQVIECNLSYLQDYRNIFLSHDQIDSFQAEICDEKPY